MKYLSNCSRSQLDVFTISSPIGNMNIACCANGVHELGQAADINDGNFVPDNRQEVKFLKVCVNEAAIECAEWLKEYFVDPVKTLEMKRPPLCVFSTPDTFRQKVWLTLLNCVPVGNTVSYGVLARMVGNPNAARAVGSAMRMNPIQIIVPCHRVIHSNGDVGAYAQGCRNTVKKWLLSHEGFDNVIKKQEEDISLGYNF